jgi:hypothetical protein
MLLRRLMILDWCTRVQSGNFALTKRARVKHSPQTDAWPSSRAKESL